MRRAGRLQVGVAVGVEADRDRRGGPLMTDT